MYVDAEDEYESLWTRFLNHDSNPNLVGKSIHESYDGRPRVWFVTRRDVVAGEELCFDYGDEYWLPDDSVV
jgi:euchromatic histone-lysine N-methyltransferase